MPAPAIVKKLFDTFPLHVYPQSDVTPAFLRASGLDLSRLPVLFVLPEHPRSRQLATYLRSRGCRFEVRAVDDAYGRGFRSYPCLLARSVHIRRGGSSSSITSSSGSGTSGGSSGSDIGRPLEGTQYRLLSESDLLAWVGPDRVDAELKADTARHHDARALASLITQDIALAYSASRYIDLRDRSFRRSTVAGLLSSLLPYDAVDVVTSSLALLGLGDRRELERLSALRVRLVKEYRKAQEEYPVDTLAQAAERFERAVASLDVLLSTRGIAVDDAGWLLETREPTLVDTLLYSYTASIIDVASNKTKATAADDRHTRSLNEILQRYEHVCTLTKALRRHDTTPVATA